VSDEEQRPGEYIGDVDVAGCVLKVIIVLLFLAACIMFFAPG
jgi:hypothetical protein